MRSLLVSIIVNNYNYGRFLREAIESALSQTYKPLEVIVVDDGSTDCSRDVIASFGARILPVFKENGGQASALNAGFARSHGDLVMFLDSDDLLLDYAIERVVSCWEQGFAKVQFHLECVNAEGRRLGVFYPSLLDPSPPSDVRPALLPRGWYSGPPTSGNVFSRSALTAVLPIDEAKYRLSADGYLHTVTPFYGGVITLQEVLGLYRIHGANAWHQDTISIRRLHWYIEHGINNMEALCATAAKFGLLTPDKKILHLRQFQYARARLVSLRLAPREHPIPGDRLFKLAVSCLESIWRSDEFKSRRKQALWMAWSLCVALLPMRFARHLILWWSIPRSFPQPLRKLFHRLT